VSTKIKVPGGKTITLEEDLSDAEVENWLREIFPAPDDRDRALELGSEAIRGFRSLQDGLIKIAQKEERNYTGVFTGILQAMQAIERMQPQVIDNGEVIRELTEAVKAIKLESVAGDDPKTAQLMLAAVERLGNLQIPAPQIEVQSPSIDIPFSAPTGYDIQFKRDGAGTLTGVTMTPTGV